MRNINPTTIHDTSLTSQTSILQVHNKKHKISGESHSMYQIRLPTWQEIYWTKQNKCFVLLMNIYTEFALYCKDFKNFPEEDGPNIFPPDHFKKTWEDSTDILQV